MRKNKLFCIVILVLITLSMLGCGTTPATESGNDINNEIMNIYRKVLLGKRDFIHTDNDNKITNIKHIGYYRDSAVDDDDIECWRFYVNDMDSDGVNEIVGELNIEEVLVLRYYDGEVYGYQFPYRGLKQLKKDGTFNFSSGASQSGYAVLEFDNEKCNYVVLGESKSDHEFYIGDKEVTLDELSDYLSKRMSDEDAQWYEFTEENINEYVK